MCPLKALSGVLIGAVCGVLLQSTLGRICGVQSVFGYPVHTASQEHFPLSVASRHGENCTQLVHFLLPDEAAFGIEDQKSGSCVTGAAVTHHSQVRPSRP